MTTLKPGDHATKELLLSKEDVVRMAAELGDPNPLHHHDEKAARSRFGGLIAAGGHVIGLLTSFGAAFTTAHGPCVGLEFSFQLRGAVPAGTALRMRWEVLAVEWSERMRGQIVSLAGEARDGDGELLVRATGKVLARDDL
ncbi:MAG TPA: MaoC family dehydratase [Anaeromyxobacteraceae bacterium]|nr:MaoC family dehydratase [Anaeromyxobacteraceae bacterium]